MTTDAGSGSDSRALILIADDEEELRKALGEYLSLEGYRIAEAADGEEALARVREVRPDLVLLDVEMPKRDGFEVCQALKGEWATRGIPVILVTGVEGLDPLIRGFEVGTDAYLNKPFSPVELLARIRSLLRNRQLPEL